ncbi:hypothetical protein P43SY_000142 [Pythium insidiosum]|uniref:Nuclear cap-binding protein subunit 2 n=1 Tax=Pythium insidiosum TaxID=114742 RepID=A0AAD5LIJ5_PYTIN|nr:hypothetical protein P43SY_000142 [Pythium insidiosum]
MSYQLPSSFLQKFTPKEIHELKRVFREHDHDAAAEISASELQTVLLKMGENVTTNQTATILKQVPLARPAYVSFQEFLNLFYDLRTGGIALDAATLMEQVTLAPVSPAPAPAPPTSAPSMHAVEPRAVNWEVVTPGKSDDDKAANAKYAISCAQKIGATVFLTFEDIVEVKPKMIMTFEWHMRQVTSIQARVDAWAPIWDEKHGVWVSGIGGPNASMTFEERYAATLDSEWHMRQVTSIQARVDAWAPIWDKKHGVWVSGIGGPNASMTFEERYAATLDSVTTSSVEGALMYLQRDCIDVGESPRAAGCRRKNDVKVIIFLEVTIANTDAALAEYQDDRYTYPEFCPFVEMRDGQCIFTNETNTVTTVTEFPPECKQFNGVDGQPDIGPCVGAAAFPTDSVAPYSDTVWFSYPNSCVMTKWKDGKSAACRQQYKGGLCPFGEKPDGVSCTFSYRILGFLKIDDLVGITNMSRHTESATNDDDSSLDDESSSAAGEGDAGNPPQGDFYRDYADFCMDNRTEFHAYDTDRTLGLRSIKSIDFWRNPSDDRANRNRTEFMIKLYNKLSDPATNNMERLPTDLKSLAKKNPPCYENAKACFDARIPAYTFPTLSRAPRTVPDTQLRSRKVKGENEKNKSAGHRLNRATGIMAMLFLADSLYLLALVHAVEPRAVNWEVVTPGKSDDDKAANAKYAISCAQKIGATVFLTFEDIVEVKPKMIMTYMLRTPFATLQFSIHTAPASPPKAPTNMAELYKEVLEEEERVLRGPQQRKYWDRKTYSSLEEQQRAIAASSTLYIGNLSFFTSEVQIYELFSRVGNVKRVIMGLDRFKKTPCGFCFVEYNTHDEAAACANFLNETKLDNRVIRVEMDGGFKEGRQFGRGASGGQVRDDRRSKDDYDPGRGGYGRSNAVSDGHHFRRTMPPRKRSRGDSFVDEPARKTERRESPSRGNAASNRDAPMEALQPEEEEEENPRFRHREKEEEEDENDDVDAEADAEATLDA